MKVKRMSKKEYIAVAASLAVVAVVGISLGGGSDREAEIKNPNQLSSAEKGKENSAPVKSAQLQTEEVSPVTANKNETVPKETPETNEKNASDAAKTDGGKTEDSKPASEIQNGENGTETSEPQTPSDSSQTSQIYEDEYEEAGLFDDGITFMWPVEGEIAMDFSNDTVVYDPTLDQFRTNDTVCILAEEGAPVACAGDGTVASVTNDYEKGTVVVVDHGDGWTTTYSQLMDNAAVAVGDKVKKGEKLGEVGAPTSFGSAIGTHLEFKICQGENAIDPKVALNG